MSKIYKLLLLISITGTSVSAVPVVPTFSTGTLNSRQETKTVVAETITSVDYRSGYEYVVSGHNIEPIDTNTIYISQNQTKTILESYYELYDISQG